VFAAVVRGLRPGGGFWISDSIAHDIPAVDRLMRQRWAEHLESLGGATYRRKVEAYVEHEDTPRPLAWQLDLLRRSGLEAVDVLHASARFASFGGVKRSTG
jgi:tRNA (cmo5U34)-methyltransferase